MPGSSSTKTTPILPTQTTENNASSSNYASPSYPTSVSSTTTISGTNFAVNSASSYHSEIGSGAIAGIVIGILVVLAIIAGFFVFRRRQRKRKRGEKHGTYTPATFRDEADVSKAELSGSMVPNGGVYMPYNKPELEAQARRAIGHSSHGISNQSRSYEMAQKIPWGAPDAYELSHSGHNIQADQRGSAQAQPASTVASSSNSGPGSSSAATAIASAPMSDGELNALKARERELNEQIEIDESLQRLKAEQAALQDRIRLAEMRRQERRNGL